MKPIRDRDLLVARAIHLLGKRRLAGREPCERHAVRGTAHVVEPDGVEGLHGIGIAAVFAAHASHEFGIALATQLNTHLHQFGNTRIDGGEGVVGQQALLEVLR